MAIQTIKTNLIIPEDIEIGSKEYTQFIKNAEIIYFFINNLPHFVDKNILDLEGQSHPVEELLKLNRASYFPIALPPGKQKTCNKDDSNIIMTADYENNELPFHNFVDIILSLFVFPNKLEKISSCLNPEGGQFIHASTPKWFLENHIQEELSYRFGKTKMENYKIYVTHKKENLTTIDYIFTRSSEPLPGNVQQDY